MPTEKSTKKIRSYVEKYRLKTGTCAPPDGVDESVIEGLSENVDTLGKPLCPCNFYPDKEKEATESRRWLCACDEMKKYKFCHCLLFVTNEGLPITEYLPEDHYGRESYGVVKDPTPDKGREGNAAVSKLVNERG